jgi:3-methylfumaryl-CoA hydratase
MKALAHRLFDPSIATAIATSRLAEYPLSKWHKLLPPRPWSPTVSPTEPIRSCFHWLYHPECDTFNFPPSASNVPTGKDGNPEIIPGVRRMWIGGTIQFNQPFYLNDTVHKTTNITSVKEKTTRSQGSVLFVERESELLVSCGTVGRDKGGGGNIVETTTHAFLHNPRYIAPPPTTKETTQTSPARSTLLSKETITDLDSSLLFQYSALTHNAHKIHYDMAYATSTEGYPNVVVHGPLVASFLLDFYQHLCWTLNKNDDPYFGYEFSYRGKAPLFLGSDLHLSAWRKEESSGQDFPESGSGTNTVVTLLAKNDEGSTVMEAKATRHCGGTAVAHTHR